MTVVGEGNKTLNTISLYAYINRDINRQIQSMVIAVRLYFGTRFVASVSLLYIQAYVYEGTVLSLFE